MLSGLVPQPTHKWLSRAHSWSMYFLFLKLFSQSLGSQMKTKGRKRLPSHSISLPDYIKHRCCLDLKGVRKANMQISLTRQLVALLEGGEISDG